MPAALINDAGGPDFAISRTDGEDYYIVEGLSVARSLPHAVAQGLPNVGAEINGMLVRRCKPVKTYQQTAPFSEIWVVFSTNYVGGSLGNRRSSYTTVDFVDVDVPNWTRHTPASGTFYVPVPPKTLILTRAIAHRMRVKQTSGIAEDAVSDFDADNVNKIRTINGRRWQYLGSTLYTGADNQQRVTVKYQSKAAVPAVAAGTYTGCDIAIPALPPLAEYVPQFQQNPTGTPSIIASDPLSRYGTMGVVPWE